MPGGFWGVLGVGGPTGFCWGSVLRAGRHPAGPGVRSAALAPPADARFAIHILYSHRRGMKILKPTFHLTIKTAARD